MILAQLIVVYACVWTVAGNDYLKGKLDEWNPRYPTFRETLDLLDRVHAQVLVEAGSARHGLGNCAGDGCSTLVFGEWARKHQAVFYSIDVDQQASMEAKLKASPINPAIKFIVQDSVAFLKHFDKKIDLLYLDSVDHQPDHLVAQVHAYNEIKEAYSKLHRKSIVLLDDCQAAYGGRCRLALEFLEQRAWKVWLSGAQILLLYHGTELPDKTPTTAFYAKQIGKTLVDNSHLSLEYYRTCPLPYYWIKARHGDIYQHSVTAEYEQENADMTTNSCYVGRSKYFGEPVHGCIYPLRGYFSFPYGNVEHKTDVYEVLVRHPAYTYAWEDGREGSVPDGTVYSRGQYIGRVKIEETWLAGKIPPKLRGAYVAYKGKEHKYISYHALQLQLRPEILV